MPQASISVRDLVGLRYGPVNLSRAWLHPARLQEGVRGHMEAAANRPQGYRREVPVEYEYTRGDWTLKVRGRIDGLLDTGEYILVEEIKTTYLDDPDELLPEHNLFYTAQLTLYAWFVAHQHPGRQVRARLTWWHLGAEKELCLDLGDQAELGGEELFHELAEELLAGEEAREQWLQRRNAGLDKLDFPFPDYRPGQQQLVETTAMALEQRQDLMVEAATGIGKTAAVLLPALRWLKGARKDAKVFFLTAKTSGRDIVLETLKRWDGLALRTVVIESRERSCQHPDSDCEHCELAQDFYRRANELMPRLVAESLLTAEYIREQALAHELCPFELGLEAALAADVVIADYNYVFDPMVQLNRFFGPGKRIPAVLLVDEAHNLVSRGRDMFSADLAKKEILDLSRDLKATDVALADQFAHVNKYFIAWNRELKTQGGGVLLLEGLPRGLPAALERLAEHLAVAPENAALGDFPRRLIKFNKIVRLLDQSYRICVQRRGGDTVVELLCLEPGPLLQKQRGRCTGVFFSGTLTPGQYYRRMLGCRQEYLDMELPSPFPRQQRLFVHIPGIRTTYSVRHRYYQPVAQCISLVAAQQAGNYIAYLPSYAYLQEVSLRLQESLPEGYRLWVQQPGMDIEQRQQLLAGISGPGANLGLAVMGGLFGEGIDLPGRRLVGSIIVGPGLPMVSAANELIREHFDQQEEEGFLYAYAIPGMLRVVQSAGRVFRTPEDKGIVVLIDDRFRQNGYRQLLPGYWTEEGLFDGNWLERIRDFWQQQV